MPNKPTTVPVLDTNSTNRTVPASSKVTDGYVLNDILPASNVNYLCGWAGDWLTWLDATFGDGAAPGGLTIPGGLDSLAIGTSGLVVGDAAVGQATGRFKRISASASGGEFACVAEHEVNSDTGSDPYVYYGLLDINHTTGTVSNMYGFRTDAYKEGAGDIANYYGIRSFYSFQDAADGGTIDNLFGCRVDGGIGSNTTCTNLYQFFAANPASAGDISACFGLYVQSITAGDVTNCGIYVAGASGAATNNYAIWVDSGTSRFDQAVVIGTAAVFGTPTPLLHVHGNIQLYAAGENGLIAHDSTQIIWDLTRESNGVKLESYSQVELWTGKGGGALGTGTPGLVVDASQNTTMSGQCQATSYRATESKILVFTMMDAGAENGSGGYPSTCYRTPSNTSFSFNDSGGTAHAVKVLALPAGCTVTAIRARLNGTSSHNYRMTLWKKAYGHTNATKMAEYVGSSDNILSPDDRSLTVTSGATTVSESVHFEAENQIASSLAIYSIEITVTMDDVTTCKP